jgi:acyl carrier protein
MNDIQKRVARCFSNVFPDLPENEIPRASTAALAGWDSLAHVTLLSSIAEEFGQSFEIEDFEELVSYPLIVLRLENQAHYSASA